MELPAVVGLYRQRCEMVFAVFSCRMTNCSCSSSFEDYTSYKLQRLMSACLIPSSSDQGEVEPSQDGGLRLIAIIRDIVLLKPRHLQPGRATLHSCSQHANVMLAFIWQTKVTKASTIQSTETMCSPPLGGYTHLHKKRSANSMHWRYLSN